MKVLIDMNLSPWREIFGAAGHECRHWSEIGDAAAPDHAIMEWALRFGHIVFTHDLDFGALLAASGAKGPSVIQLRAEDTRPSSMGALMISMPDRFSPALQEGALVTIDPRRAKATLLPLKKT